MKTNTVNTENVNYLKFNILNMVNSFVNIEQMFDNIENAMNHFNYESELVETIVYSFIHTECSNKLEEINKRFIKSWGVTQK